MRLGKASMTMLITIWVAKLLFRDNFKPVEAIRKELASRKYPPCPPPPRSLRKRCKIDRDKNAQGFDIYRLTPREGGTDIQMLYIHGGAYTFQLMKGQWGIVEELVSRTGATVTVPIYPLAPEYDYRPAFEMIQAIYDDLVSRYGTEHLIVSGDSAGGGFAVALSQRLLQHKQPLPSALLLFSPWMDVRLSDQECKAIQPSDPVLSIDNLRYAGKLWAGSLDPSDPLISPGNGPVAGLPPMVIFQGTHDILKPASLKFAERAKAAGVKVHLFVYEGAFHVFNVARYLPESKDVYARIGQLFS